MGLGYLNQGKSPNEWCAWYLWCKSYSRQGTPSAIAHHRPANKHFLSGNARCFPTFREARLVASLVALDASSTDEPPWEGCFLKNNMFLRVQAPTFHTQNTLDVIEKKQVSLSFHQTKCWKWPTWLNNPTLWAFAPYMANGRFPPKKRFSND